MKINLLLAWRQTRNIFFDFFWVNIDIILSTTASSADFECTLTNQHQKQFNYSFKNIKVSTKGVASIQIKNEELSHWSPKYPNLQLLKCVYGSRNWKICLFFFYL